MHVFNAVTGEILPITESAALLHMSVAYLKTVVSVLSCFPVSTFRLSTSSGVELYDCNQLQDYAAEVGMVCFLSLPVDVCNFSVTRFNTALVWHEQTHSNVITIRFLFSYTFEVTIQFKYNAAALWWNSCFFEALLSVWIHGMAGWSSFRVASRDTD